MSKTNLIGEFECKVDEKSRIILPSGLKKQVSQDAQDRFVLNRGFEGCLVLYPMNVWKDTTEQINKLNLYVQKNRNFVRLFYNGATELTLDNQNRLLLPKSLLGYAGIEKRSSYLPILIGLKYGIKRNTGSWFRKNPKILLNWPKK